MKTVEELTQELAEANAKLTLANEKVSEWKAYSREHETEAKALKKDFESKLKNSVAEEVSKATAEKDKELKTFKAEKVALKAGIPAELAGRLSGNTDEELEADALSIAAALNIKNDNIVITDGKATFKPVAEQGTGTTPAPTDGVKVKSAEEFSALW